MSSGTRLYCYQHLGDLNSQWCNSSWLCCCLDERIECCVSEVSSEVLVKGPAWLQLELYQGQTKKTLSVTLSYLNPFDYNIGIVMWICALNREEIIFAQL